MIRTRFENAKIIKEVDEGTTLQEVYNDATEWIRDIEQRYHVRRIIND
jgi:hypothetical protein